MISQPARLLRSALVIGAVTVVCGCSTQATAPAGAAQRAGAGATPVVRDSHVGARAAAAALDQIGVPYRYGGSTPAGFDCSGLVQYAYGRAGKAMPRTTAALWNAAPTVDRHNLRPGDLLFFRIAGKMSHVGMYVGGGRFVHAPSSGRTVSIESLRSDFYSTTFIRAGRPQ